MGVPVSRARVAGAVSSDSRVTNVTCYKLEICFLNLLIQTENKNTSIYLNENRDIAIAMSSSRADPVLGLNILQG